VIGNIHLVIYLTPPKTSDVLEIKTWSEDTGYCIMT